MNTSEEMQRVLRDLLSSCASDMDAAGSSQRLLYLTSDWAAPADAHARGALEAAAARTPVMVLRQRLLDDAESFADAALSATEKTVPAEYAPVSMFIHICVPVCICVCLCFDGVTHTHNNPYFHYSNVRVNSIFRDLCKHFHITALPASVLLDVSSVRINVAVNGMKSTLFYAKLTTQCAPDTQSLSSIVPTRKPSAAAVLESIFFFR